MTNTPRLLWQRLMRLLRKVPKSVYISSASIVAVLIYVGIFVLPRSIDFSYASTSTCVGQLTFLPGLHKTVEDSQFSVTNEGGLKIGAIPIIATKTCVQPTVPPQPGVTTVATAPFGSLLFRKHLAVTVGETPAIDVAQLHRPVPATKVLPLTLSSPDTVNKYRLIHSGVATVCTPEQSRLMCDLSPLKLEQGQHYDIAMQRQFGDEQPATIFTTTLTTLTATQVVDSTVKPGETVFAKPQEFTFTVNKPLERAKLTLVKQSDNKETPIDIATSIDQATITGRIDAELDRSADYTLTIASLEAQDGSSLADPYVVPFHISGGPRVTGVNIGKHSVPSSARVIVTFDQALSDKQDISKLVTFTGGAAAISRSGNQVVYQLQNLPRCAPFTLTIGQGLTSAYEVASSEGWQYSSRTRCSTSEVIGYSAKGRPIMAHVYGNGGTSYVYLGAIHGNEMSSRTTMERWMSDLEANPEKIPAHARVIVVPTASPDGVATGSRLNGNGVNLNRNFPTANWTGTIITSSGEQAGGGGASAGSEPETRALMQLTSRYAPKLVVTHHSQGYLVNSNDAGVSIAAGQEYARLARYQFIPNSATTSTFGFEMTGTYEDWLLERGIAAILVELDTNTGNHYGRNQAAMWAMLSR